MRKNEIAKKSESSKFLNESNSVSRAFYVCPVMTKKLIIAGLYKIVPNFDPMLYRGREIQEEIPNFNWRTFTAEFSVAEFCNIMNIENGGTERKAIDNAIKTAIQQTVLLKDESSTAYIPWFSEAKFDNDANLIKLVFNPRVMQAALDIRGKYSNLELDKVGKLRSFYSIRYYELCKSFYNTRGKYGNAPGEWRTFEIPLDELKEMFQTGEAYKDRVDNFVACVIKKPIEELNSVGLDFDVEIEIVRKGGGRKIRGVIFKCKDKTSLKTISKTDSFDQKKAKKESNDDRIKLEEAKKNPMWKTVSQDVKNMAKDTGTYIKPGLMFDIAVYSEMQHRGFIK